MIQLSENQINTICSHEFTFQKAIVYQNRTIFYFKHKTSVIHFGTDIYFKTLYITPQIKDITEKTYLKYEKIFSNLIQQFIDVLKSDNQFSLLFLTGELSYRKITNIF